MQFITFFTSAIVATLALAAPTAEPVAEAEIEARAPAVLMDVWENAGFLGNKLNAAANPGDCVDFKSPFIDSISSAKARPGFRCTLWVNTKCNGGAISFDVNGIVNLAKVSPNFNDKASSWKCVK